MNKKECKTVALKADNMVVITKLSVQNDELFRYVSKDTNPEKAIIRALEVGAISLNRIVNSNDVDFLAKKTSDHFNTLEKTITTFIKKSIDPSNAQSVTKNIMDIFKIQNGQVQDMIKHGEINVGEIGKKLEGFKEALQAELQKALGKVITENSGIGLLLKQVQKGLQELREEIIKKNAESTFSANIKGSNFEEMILSEICDWAKAYQKTSKNGIIVEDTRTVTGGIGKQGDCTVDFQTPINKKVVIEIKAQEKISTPKILEVLDKSLENRSAEIAIFVAPSMEYLPKELGAWAQFNNKIICISSVIDVALRYAAINMILCNNEDSAEIDVERVESLLSEVKIQMRKFSSLLTSARATVKAASKTEELIGTIRDAVNGSLDQLSGVLRIID